MTRASATMLDSVVARIEQASILDRPSEILVSVLDRAIPAGRVQELASGSFLGHPLHPALVAVPIGSWVSANLLDLTGGDARTTQRLVGIGTLAAAIAAYTGANDWRTTTGAARRVGLVHALLNDVALGLYFGSWRARRGGRRAKGAVLALAGTGAVGASGWLGGHLSYTLGVGVRPAADRPATR
jgi:uncharacterized membrane protein